MKTEQLFRLAGLAAILAGLARIAVAFPLLSDPIAAQWAYTAIDVLLLLGLIGIYLRRAGSLGFLGLASFGVGVAALSFIGGPDADPFGFSTYEQGAAVLAIALVGLSVAWVRANQRPLAPPLLWFASLVAAGALSALPAPWPAHGYALAGALFGAGFVAAGVDLWRSQSKGAGS
ncbi:MAG: hypothetical protein K2P58_14010 [Hyphomonadaceae bacterium]|nr:hypothetical protein [Hyphomonadaceae bacterium]